MLVGDWMLYSVQITDYSDRRRDRESRNEMKEEPAHHPLSSVTFLERPCPAAVHDGPIMGTTPLQGILQPAGGSRVASRCVKLKKLLQCQSAAMMSRWPGEGFFSGFSHFQAGAMVSMLS